MLVGLWVVADGERRRGLDDRNGRLSAKSSSTLAASANGLEGLCLIDDFWSANIMDLSEPARRVGPRTEGDHAEMDDSGNCTS